MPVDTAAVITVRAVLRDLPARQCETLVHRYCLGRSTAETAYLMGVSEEAVKQLTHRAVARLREVLLPEHAEEVEDA